VSETPTPETQRQRARAPRAQGKRLRAQIPRPAPLEAPAQPQAEASKEVEGAPAPLLIGEGLDEDSTGEHEVPQALVQAFMQAETSPGAPTPEPVEEAQPKESWREALEGPDAEAHAHDVLTFSDLNGPEIGRRPVRERGDEPLTYEQIDAIIQRTARMFQKRPEELSAASIQQVGQREFQLGPADMEQVIEALGIYQREVKERARRARTVRAFKYATGVLLAALVVGGGLRGKSYMERRYRLALNQQYIVFVAMQQRREALVTHGKTPATPIAERELEETRQHLKQVLARYDETAMSYNALAQTAPLSWIVWFFELPDSVITSREINGLYLMDLD
jgi:hypothetical protein